MPDNEVRMHPEIYAELRAANARANKAIQNLLLAMTTMTDAHRDLDRAMYAADVDARHRGDTQDV